MTVENKAKDKKINPVIIISVFLIGGFVSYLNGTLMTTALPTIMRDLKIDPVTGQWLTTAFMLVNGIMIPCTAFLIEKFTTRKLFFISMGLFTIGTFIGSFSIDFKTLLIARIVQAAGAGIILPLMQTVFLIIVPKERRGFVMGLVGIIVAFAPAMGPTLAGFIVDNYPWRYLFHIIDPICIIDLVFAYFALQNVTETKDVKIDIMSVITSTLGFGGLLLGFSNAGNKGWGSLQVLIPLIVGIISLLMFVKKQLSSKEPMLNLRVFKSKTFTFSTIIIMIVYAAFVSAELILPMYIQMARGYSAIDSGLMLMPGAIIMGVMNPIAGRLFDKIGARTLSIVGLILLTFGNLGLMFLSANTEIIHITIVYSIRLLGMSMIMMPLTTAGLNTLTNEHLAHGTAANNTLRQIAGSIGTALLVTVMSKATISSGIKNSELASIHGMNVAFGVSALLSFIALVIAIIVVKKKGEGDTKLY
ncbi:MDR family MFS transporter [Eubacterium multiforme]|uniref:EmrB/QacA subfamily drug resistance transporter n=1 Tax=Eubacterium multiforme TaxID=83339 RepID=A0ABT9UTB0_9FIRM|nr:MDR family MFS transporter [Eubacterium multiforme]MDQ0149520.1 EmrB/QacA subfamily drug resistance transporter [Eubacterium multiforme]